MTRKSCDRSLEWSRRIERSLEMELGLGDDVKRHGTHGVHMYSGD